MKLIEVDQEMRLVIEYILMIMVDSSSGNFRSCSLQAIKARLIILMKFQQLQLRK